MSPLGWVGVFLLGGAGALARLTVARAVSARAGARLPFGTLTVNLSGALLLGVLAALTLPDRTTLLVGTAAIGSFTTFSTWLFETHQLAHDGRRRAAALNVVGSLVLGIAAVTLGRHVGAAL